VSPSPQFLFREKYLYGENQGSQLKLNKSPDISLRRMRLGPLKYLQNPLKIPKKKKKKKDCVFSTLVSTSGSIMELAQEYIQSGFVYFRENIRKKAK
jgi:hypothetical protein